jgi:PAS domain S-box-containing protein
MMRAMDLPRSESESKRALEAQLRATLNLLPVYAWYTTASGALTFVNERHADYLGLPKDHPLRFGIDVGAEWDSHIPLLHPDDHAEMRRAWSHCLRTGCPGEVSFRARNAEGGYRWFLSRVEPLRASDGTLLYWMGVTLDIEERKQAEEKLRRSETYLIEALADVKKSEDRLRLVIDTIPVQVTCARPDGSLDFINRRWREYLGVPVEVVQDWGWTTVTHPEDVERFLRGWRSAMASGEPFEDEARVLRADGQYRRLLIRAVPLRNNFGTITSWYSAGVDIEDRKRAEEELRRNEFYLSEGQRLAHMGSWAFNVAGFEYWSSELFRIYGLDPTSKPPTVEKYLDLVHPEDREFMEHGIQKMLADHREFDFTKRIVRPDGKTRFVRCVGVPRTHGETFLGFVGTGMDITEQEQLTEELRRSEAYLAEAQRLSHTGSFGWKPDTGEIVWSDETYRIFEYDRSVKPTIDSVMERVHPQDRAEFQKVIDGASGGRQISSMPIVCCCLTGGSSTSTRSLTLYRMHLAIASLSGR